MVENRTQAEQLLDILVYTWPEMITAFVLHVLPRLLESGFIGNLKSTSTYAALGLCVTLIHFIIKVAEGLSTGTLVLVGNDNGVGDYEGAGKTLKDSFWTSAIIGFVISALIYYGPHLIFSVYDIDEKIVNKGVSYLQLRAVSIFFMFIYFSLVGFLRGIKNTRVPMVIFAMGALSFILISYPLIFGYWGLPKMKLRGAALAGVLQFALMALMAMVYVFYAKSTRKYRISFFHPVDMQRVKNLFSISSPIMLDKATMAIVPLWLGQCFSPLGKVALAAFSIIKDLERLMLLPANALGQVSTLLVSNYTGAGEYGMISRSVKRILLLLSVLSVFGLMILLVWRKKCICLFDHKDVFTDFSAAAFLVLGPLMLLDSLQLVLSGVLRGAKRVRIVMLTRLIIVFGLFIPITYIIKRMAIESDLLKFIAIYVIFYICTGIMSFVYWYYIKNRLKSH